MYASITSRLDDIESSYHIIIFIYCTYSMVARLSEGRIDEEAELTVNLLRSRPQPPPQSCTTICGTNEEVDYYNLICLESLQAAEYTLTAIDINPNEHLDRKAPKLLRLKVAAPIMLTTNLSVEHGLVNGRPGTVSAIFPQDGLVLVRLDGNDYDTHVSRFHFHSRGATRQQFPLKLGWSKTVHRTQATTIPGPVHVVADKITQPGQLGVALSRSTDINLLSVSGTIAKVQRREDVHSFYSTLSEVCCHSKQILL